MAERDDNEAEAYLARIRRTIAESSRLVDAATLRIAETDRLLESQGLTREQVMNFRFTEAQREAVNRELVRQGMEPLEEGFGGEAGWDASREALDASHVSSLTPSSAPDTELAERQRKFGMMMKPFQI